MAPEIVDKYNRLMAEFMAEEIDKEGGRYRLLVTVASHNLLVWKRDDLRYHYDYNWLMPLYFKINKLIQDRGAYDWWFATDAEPYQLELWEAFEDSSDEGNLEVIYLAIGKFLEFYREWLIRWILAWLQSGKKQYSAEYVQNLRTSSNDPKHWWNNT